jgi:hypothetical protein
VLSKEKISPAYKTLVGIVMPQMACECSLVLEAVCSIVFITIVIELD